MSIVFSVATGAARLPAVGRVAQSYGPVLEAATAEITDVS